ncbi:hypothetical protein AGRA671_26090 [Agrobacterium radiobacter]
MALRLIGACVVVTLIAIGATWLLNNVRIKRNNRRPRRGKTE